MGLLVVGPTRFIGEGTGNGFLDVGDTVAGLGGIVLGTLSVTNLAQTVNTEVFAGGTEAVGGLEPFDPTLATGTTLTATDFFGRASSASFQIVENGGTAVSTTVNADTFQDVRFNGVANATRVNFGGIMQVFSGGVASGATVSAGGLGQVLDGGVASGTTLSGTGNGVLAANLFVGNGLAPLARTVSTIVNNFGLEQVFISGVASNTVVNSGGHQLINNGDAVGTLVNLGGAELVFNGGATTSTTLVGGAQVLGQNFMGFSTATTINAAGTEVVFQGGATRTLVNNGTLVDWGMGTQGTTGLLFSGTSLSATVNSGGFLFDVGPAAFDGSSTLNGGGMFVTFNATASATIVNSGSVLTLLGSGTGSSTETAAVINRGGIEVVSSGGLDIATVVRGQEFVQAAGSARGVDVLAGGIQSVLAGGVVANTFIDGGTVEMTSGAMVGNIPLSFSADTGGVLLLDFSQGFTGTIAGFASPLGVTEFIDLRDIQFGTGTTVKFTQTGTSGTLTVTDTAMHFANLTLLGTYSTANFTLSSDGAGGTTVKDPAVVASAITLASHA